MTGNPARSTAWQNALTVVQCVKPPSFPADAEAMTVVNPQPGSPPRPLPCSMRSAAAPVD